MTSWTDDEGLMEELARATRQEDEVPEHRRRAAYAAFAWRTIDEDLLSLTHDSLLTGTAAVRGPEDARTLSFEGGGLSLELEVDGSVLTGQVLLTGSLGEVTMERTDGESRTTRTDASGFFSLSDAAGTVRFAFELEGISMAYSHIGKFVQTPQSLEHARTAFEDLLMRSRASG